MANSLIKIYSVRDKPIPRYFSVVASIGIVALLSSFIYWIGGFSSSVAAVTCSSGSFTETTSGPSTHIIRFTAGSTSTDGSCTFTVPDDVYAVDYLVVAGGGGGNSGGGGAGGVVTSWRIRNQADSADVAGRQTPITVYPGDQIAVTVGIGGVAGSGGAISNWRNLTIGTNGHSSSFGSVVAAGGGAGGFGYGCSGGASNTFCTDSGTVTTVATGQTVYNLGGGSGGSGGGSSYDFVGNPGGTADTSTVVGATSSGSNGGQTGGSGGYRAGAGGGGAGSAGGSARATPGDPTHGFNSNNGNHNHAGGDGGAGIRSDIGGSSTIYACGGGGGINDNNGDNVARNYTNSSGTVNGAGAAGCTGAGSGSNLIADGALSAISLNGASRFNGTAGGDDFGHGGGGTDPESTLAGRGGSGVVIIRYTIPDPLCPNDSNATPPATLPVACPTTISVTAGVTTYRELDMRGAPYSYSRVDSTTVSLIASPAAMDVVRSGNLLRIRVTPETNTLIGGTYPVIYSLTDSNTSESYILVNVIDPGQHTPLQIPVDPRATEIFLPSLIVGNVRATQICIQNETSTANYANPLTIDIPVANRGSETRTALARGGLRLNGSNAVVGRSINFIQVTAPNGETILSRGRSRVIHVNVSNTATGGNGSCSFGTASTITLVPLDLWQNPRQGTVTGNFHGG